MTKVKSLIAACAVLAAGLGAAVTSADARPMMMHHHGMMRHGMMMHHRPMMRRAMMRHAMMRHHMMKHRAM